MNHSMIEGMGDLRQREIVDRELKADERVLWITRPNALLVARPSGVLLVFGFLFLSSLLGAFIDTVHVPHGLDLGGIVFAVTFAVVIIGLSSVPIQQYYVARRTTYAITDRRIMVICDFGKTKKVESYLNLEPNDLKRTEHANGSGDLHLIWRRSNTRDMHGDVVLIGIPNVREVEEIVRETCDRSVRRF